MAACKWSTRYAICGIVLALFASIVFSHTVTLSWNAPVSSSLTLTGYNVYKLAGACPTQPSLSAFTKVGTTSTTVLTFSDTNIADATTNCYSVTASYGSIESGAGFYLQATTTMTIAVTPATPPSQVTVSAN